MSIDDLRAFLETEQGICASRELCLEIINECEPSAQLREKEMLGIDGFTRLIYGIRKLLTKNTCLIFSIQIERKKLENNFFLIFWMLSLSSYII